MRKARIVNITRQAGALAVAALTAASTLNGYRPLARNGYASLWSWAFGLVVTELPLQTLVSQLGGLAFFARRLTRPVLTVAWLVAGLSALGLLDQGHDPREHRVRSNLFGAEIERTVRQQHGRPG